MSAFTIPLSHMDALIAYGALHTDGDRLLRPIRLTVPGDSPVSADGQPVTIDFAEAEHRDDIGRILYEANAEGLAAVYPDPTSPGGEQIADARALSELYTFKPATGTANPAEIIGACDCAEYQCDSAESYAMSLAQWILAAIRAKAAGELREGWTIENPARDSELDSAIDALASAGAGATAEPEPSPRAALLAKMGAALDGGPALPDPAEPEPAPEPGPKPEPETVKAKAAKPGKAAKGRKAPAAKAGKNKAGGKRAKTPAGNAAAPRAKGKAPANA